MTEAFLFLFLDAPKLGVWTMLRFRTRSLVPLPYFHSIPMGLL